MCGGGGGGGEGETFYVSAAEVLFLCYFAWKEKSCSLFPLFLFYIFFVGSDFIFLYFFFLLARRIHANLSSSSGGSVFMLRCSEGSP